MRAARLVPLLVLLAPPLHAQQWLPADSIPLVRRAITQRSARDADTMLSGWRARAHGIVRFASVIEHGGFPVERVIKVDELRVEVYGEAPNRSKQVITAWRDTTYLPNRVVYHRDHLGIVAHDFGATIRIGEGDEVRDVVHPLSPTAPGQYLYSPGDTVVIGGASQPIRVVAVAVRPADPRSAATVGTLFIDIDRAALVRFRFTFTPGAYRDASLDEITVALENALQDGQRWLPWRQAIVISRGTRWLDLPVRTIIRGDWVIDEYELGIRHPPQSFGGSLIGGLRRPAPDTTWDGPIDARLPGLPATEADVGAARDEAVRAIGARLAGLPRTQMQAGGISGLLRVNRVQGVTPAVAGRVAVGAAWDAEARVGVGLSDRRIVGNIALKHHRDDWTWSVNASRDVRDVSDFPIISGATNSLLAAVGRDRLDWYLSEQVAAAATRRVGGRQLVVELRREWTSSVAGTSGSGGGTERPNPAIAGDVYTVPRIWVSSWSPAGHGWSLDAEAGAGGGQWARILGHWRGELASGIGFVVRGGAGTSQLPISRSFVVGGRGTLPGVGHRTMGGRRSGTVELGWTRPVAVPTPPVPGLRAIQLPSRGGLFVAAGVVGGDVRGAPWRATGRVEPVVGLRVDLWGPLVRVEGGVSLRTGAIAVMIDAHPDWWPML